MRTCDDCRIVLESDVRYCPKCGKGIAAEQEAEDESASELRSLIASANLNRINGDWDAAVADASLALKHDPNNPEVASLLAGIYEQRGNLDEAQVWYKIAVDLEPSSSAYRARLHRVDGQIATKDGRGRGRHRALATWLLVGAVLLVLVAVSVYAVLSRSAGRSAPELAGNRAKTPEAVSQKQILNPMGGAESGQSATQPLAGGGTAGPTGGSVLRTPAEIAIRTAASESNAAKQARAQIDDVIADPRQAIATVTFSVPGSAPLTKERILTTAMGIAQAAFAANREVKFVTARCIIGAGASAQMAFVGDIARAGAEGLPESPSAEQTDSAFTDKWWNPQVR